MPKGDLPLDTMVALTINAANLAATATQAFAQAQQPPAQQPPATQEPPAPQPPANTPTATNTPNPTISPTDPKQGLGSPTWKKEFNSENDWNTYNNPGDRAEIKNGKLYFTMDSPIYSIWTFAAPTIENYYLEILATTPAACSGKDRYGLIVQTPKDKYSEGYLLNVSCDGEARFLMYDGSSNTILIPWTSNAAIKSGPNQTNTIGVKRNGSQFGIYVNGVLIGQVTDNTYTGKGKFGVLIDADNTNDYTIIFDDAAYWTLP